MTLEGKETVILSAYLDITKEEIAEHLVKAIEYCKKRRFAILLGVESNAHSDNWGHSNNNRGNDLVDCIMQEGLEIHKKGKNMPMRALLENLSLISRPILVVGSVLM